MAGRARTVPVRMTIKRERKLRQIIAAGTSPQRLVPRARIVLAAAEGKENAAIARDLGCSEGRGGRRLTGRARGWPSRSRNLCPAGRGIIVVARPARLRAAQTRRGRVARHRRPGAGRRARPPAQGRGWLNRADDPAFWTRVGQVCRLYLDPPPGTVLISIDEKTGIRAKTRICPDIPGRPGRSTRREFEYRRHGTVSVIAAMNVATGEVISQRITRNDSPAIIRFLSMLDQSVPLACVFT